MVCYVIKPLSASNINLQSPSCINSCQVMVSYLTYLLIIYCLVLVIYTFIVFIQLFY